MIALSILAMLCTAVAFPFILALTFHAAAVVVEGLPCRVDALRVILRKAIGRAFRAPSAGVSKRSLARCLRFPSTGIGALARALVAYRTSVAKSKASAGLRRAMVAIKVYVAAEAIGLRSRVRATVATFYGPVVPLVDLRVDPVTRALVMLQGETIIGTVVPTPAGPMALPAEGAPYLAHWARSFMPEATR